MEEKRYEGEIKKLREDVDWLKNMYMDGSIIFLREGKRLEMRLDKHDRRVCEIEELLENSFSTFNPNGES